MERKDFRAGQKWLVVREGASLEGMVPIEPYAYGGWACSLHVGDVITCRGESWTFGDGVLAIKWIPPDGDQTIADCIFRPCTGGMWGGMVPADGYLEPIIE